MKISTFWSAGLWSARWGLLAVVWGLFSVLLGPHTPLPVPAGSSIRSLWSPKSTSKFQSTFGPLKNTKWAPKVTKTSQNDYQKWSPNR